MKKLTVWFFISFALILALMIGIVVALDPFFHYHRPLKGFFYRLNNERVQNLGIAKTFDYDAILTGTSLVQGFRTSDFNERFGVDAVKLALSGATWHETAQLIEAGYNSGQDIRLILRSLDVNHLTDASDLLRTDLGDFPYYLYNDSLLDDGQYVCNRDIMLDYCVPMLWDRLRGVPGGHTSFDEFDYVIFRPGDVLLGRTSYGEPAEIKPYTEEDERLLTENLTVNVVNFAQAHPETTWKIFLPPYNIEWWGQQREAGELERTCTLIRRAMEILGACDNIELYSYADRMDITTNLENYADYHHYTNEISDQILAWIQAGEGRVTASEAADVAERLKVDYDTYDYQSVFH